MAKGKTDKTRFTAANRRLFLDHLAHSANVAASERHAGMAPRSAYFERRRSAAFSAQWAEALAEGYARLEADMLADALLAPSAKTSEPMLKARMQKNRMGINLLNWHRASVKAAAPMVPRLTNGDLPALKLQLNLTLNRMRERAGIPLEGASLQKGGQKMLPPAGDGA